jgi:hypothetical protein
MNQSAISLQYMETRRSVEDFERVPSLTLALFFAMRLAGEHRHAGAKVFGMLYSVGWQVN